MENEDTQYWDDLKDTLDQAKEIKEHFKLESIDTAILLLIEQGIDTIRFNNSD